ATQAGDTCGCSDLLLALGARQPFVLSGELCCWLSRAGESLRLSPLFVGVQQTYAGFPCCSEQLLSAHRISYCTTDKLQNKVFAYIAQSQESGALECHAFLSPKKKIAQAVTLTVAQAFQMALDLWEAANTGSRQEQPLHPPCVLERSEPSRASEPAPPGSPPFRHQFGEEEEEEEDENLDEALSGGACGGGLAEPVPLWLFSCTCQASA
uniref:PID domain-containing protein n=1 Tax=Pavo cristatus TaxID=9049 RepID=A0A8C9FPM4_PAVCR